MLPIPITQICRSQWPTGSQRQRYVINVASEDLTEAIYESRQQAETCRLQALDRSL